jgi:hypothetical protein
VASSPGFQSRHFAAVFSSARITAGGAPEMCRLCASEESHSIRAMKLRKLLLLLILYFSVDFAMPQLPGAVWADDDGEDWVEAVPVHRLRADRYPAVVRSPQDQVQTNRSRITEALVRSLSSERAPLEWSAEFRRAPLLSSDPPSSTDDH